jgi:dTDP-4-amino-4,6-dideoxygalactose transaminase
MGSFSPIWMPVHQYGVPLDIGPINELKKRYVGSMIVEDAACALGSRYPNGKFVGNSGNLVCFSLHPRKVFTAGEGGLIVIPDTCDAAWFEQYRNFGLTATPFSQHGKVSYMEPDAHVIGFNCKMSEFQAAVGLSQVESMQIQMHNRLEIQTEYDELMLDMGLHVLEPLPGSTWNVQNYRVLFKDQETRDKARDHLRANRVSAKNTIRPLTNFAALKRFPVGHACVNSDSVYERGLWLPIFSEMTTEDVQCVADLIKEVLV